MEKGNRNKRKLNIGTTLGLIGLSAFLTSPINQPAPSNKEGLSQIVMKELVNSPLEEKVELFIREKRAENNLYSDEKTAWSVYDFSTGEKVVSINEDVPMQCASMVKPFLALAFYHLEQEGKVGYNKKTKKEMEKMIQNSSNVSTNYIIKQIGGPRKVQKILSDNYPEIFKNTSIKEYIPKGGKTYKNKASASDYTRFLYYLWNNELPRSNEIKRLMRLPNRDRIYTGVKNIPKGTIVYDKTGTTSHLVGDMGILYIKSNDGKRKPYVFVGIIEKQKRLNGAEETKRWWNSRGNIIRDISGIVYDEIK